MGGVPVNWRCNGAVVDVVVLVDLEERRRLLDAPKLGPTLLPGRGE